MAPVTLCHRRVGRGVAAVPVILCHRHSPSPQSGDTVLPAALLHLPGGGSLDLQRLKSELKPILQFNLPELLYDGFSVVCVRRQAEFVSTPRD